MTEVPKLAFLGPFGTFSHQAAYDRFGESVEYVQKRTITDVFNALSPSSRLAVIPQENSIFGTVIETYDLLRSSVMGVDKFVRGEITLEVQHCLIVRRGVELSNITKVLSHEQALGQCSEFINKNLPHASLVKTDSTSEAAKCLLSSEYNLVACAAICSRVCATVFEGLEILMEGIQNASSNFTRFYILSTDLGAPLPRSVDQRRSAALVKLTYEASTDIAPLISAMGLPTTRIDRRPSLSPVPFHDLYFIEIDAGPRGADSFDSWMKGIEGGIQRVAKIGGSAVVVGAW